MRRAWINQPSTLQQFHKLNGVNVLEDENHSYYKGTIWTIVYFTAGPVHSQVIARQALSEGWVNHPSGPGHGRGTS